MEQLNEIFVAFAQNEMFSVFFRIAYAIGVLIFFIKGEVSVSKFAQTFSNLEQRFMLSGDNKVIPKPELDDCQAEIQSHKDDCLSAFLDKYLPQLQANNPLCEIDDSDIDVIRSLSGPKADRLLNAYEGVLKLRTTYKIPDHFTDEEVVEYIRELNIDYRSKLEGGEAHEKKAQSQSKQEELPSSGSEGSQA